MTADRIAALTVGQAATDIGHSIREAFCMFWDTLWALVLGFGLSGAVQAFVSRSEIQAHLGNHRPAAVGRSRVQWWIICRSARRPSEQLLRDAILMTWSPRTTEPQ